MLLLYYYTLLHDQNRLHLPFVITPSRNLETTVPFQDRSVCKGITKALPDTHTFNVFEPNQIICRGSD